MLPRLLLSLVAATLASAADIVHPAFAFDSFGGRLGLLGDFDLLSSFDTVNQTQAQDGSGDHLFLYDSSSLRVSAAGHVNGIISDVQPMGDESVVVNGNITEVNGDQVQAPFIYNWKNKTARALLPSTNKRDDSSLKGEVSTFLVDGDLIYLGGDFEFNGTHGAAVYDTKAQKLRALPFGGFGANSLVNAIAKIFGDNDGSDANDANNHGSIVFGGLFTTLGARDVLVRNTTNVLVHNTTVPPRQHLQPIAILGGQVSSNGDSDDADLLACPQTDGKGGKPVWQTPENQGALWTVSLPQGMAGVRPLKVRLTVPLGDNLATLFRLYTEPNNGIMNLSYVDPASKEVRYCDAWCPLAALSELQDASADGDYTTAGGKDSTAGATIGFGGDFQDFALANPMQVTGLTLTVVGWKGDRGALSGFEVFSDTQNVYANNQFNQGRCGGAAAEGSSGAGALSNSTGQWDATAGHLSTTQGEGARVEFAPQIAYSGDYQLNWYTPGCAADGTCARRAIVDVRLVDTTDGSEVALERIYQNNENDKFDYLYHGHLDGDHEYRVEMSYVGQVTPGTEPFVVADRLLVLTVSIDDDQRTENEAGNGTSFRLNRTVTGGVARVKLNGLFEYSLANFSDFDAANLTRGDYVGNSLINLLSGRLPEGANVLQIATSSSGMVVLGDNLGSEVLSFAKKGYNSTGGEALVLVLDGKLARRDQATGGQFGDQFAGPFAGQFAGDQFELAAFELAGLDGKLVRRDQFELAGAQFDGKPSSVFAAGSQWVFLGNFSVGNFSNVAVYDTDKKAWKGLKQAPDAVYTQFANSTIDDTEYWVFSNAKNEYLQVEPKDLVSAPNLNDKRADPSLFKRAEPSLFKRASSSSKPDLRVRLAVPVLDSQQLLSGSGFSIADYYGRAQAYMDAQNNFTGYDGLTVDRGLISHSFYINDLVLVIAGRFKTELGVENLGFLADGSVAGLADVDSWLELTLVHAVYVNNALSLLVVATNGLISTGSAKLNPGVVLYNLTTNSWVDAQPPALDNDGPLKVNSVVMHDHRVLVGGDFSHAGSLDCQGLCIYDVANTRWMAPSSNGLVVTGVPQDIRFFAADQVFIGGELKLDGRAVPFVVYNFELELFSLPEDGNLNSLGHKTVSRFVVTDKKPSDKLKAPRMVAYGPDYVSGYTGKQWVALDSDIGDNPQFSDMKVLPLKDKNGDNNGLVIDEDQGLALAGNFVLKLYGGPVAVAVFNGSAWVPHVAAGLNGSAGSVKSLLLDDRHLFLDNKLLDKLGKLLVGKVVGISLACALGSTTLLGLLYLVPYLVLFRKQLDGNYYDHPDQRIDEKEMMDAVNPDDLLHEIDLHRPPN